ncbi:MAG TPA: cupredoxin domain-containing protein [Chloroflexota bacterium]|nr:cupredoxin domain-containing protein [Chloroflexota bacterium]
MRSTPAGTTVTWRNEDQEDHDVLSLDLSFASPIVKPGTTYPQLFSEPGTFPYLCDLHANMEGVVTVTAGRG